MAILETRRLEAKFELRDSVVHALRGIDLDVEEGEFFVLLGPSGCGKTTMLRSIAGLERPTAGEIRIDGQPVFDAAGRLFVPPDSRPIAMVFQSYAIWPHMDVYETSRSRCGVVVPRWAMATSVYGSAKCLRCSAWVRWPIGR